MIPIVWLRSLDVSIGQWGFDRSTAQMKRSAYLKRHSRSHRSAVQSVPGLVILIRPMRRPSSARSNPIHKDSLYRAGFRHPGHTEYLAELAGAVDAPVMMLVCPTLRTVPVTIHLALGRAIASLSSAGIAHAGRVTAAALRQDFGIGAPILAVAGLNPHAGETGALGDEEINVIEPALAELRAAGIDARGPLPSDTMFHVEARRSYDAALCMYHDQALIPIKTIDFHGAVNVTLGLPFVRTSPDHGTAFGIAGRGTARADSLIAALRLAAQMAARRQAAA